MKEIFKTVLADFYKSGIPKHKNRKHNIPLDSEKIITLTGPRRAGKTYLLFQLMENIADKTNIIYINFEDERIKTSGEELNTIIEAYFELFPDKNWKDIYFFFDEIQEIEEWQKFVRRIYDTISKNILITGSSAKLLSREIATNLRGRSINFDVFPLSFEEYLNFRTIEIDLNSTLGKSRIRKEFREYLHNGGFPETIEMSENIRQKTLQSYLDVMMYRDLIERFNISNVTALKYLINKLLANTSKVYSLNKIYNELKSRGIKISRENLSNFTDHIEDTYIIFSMEAFTESVNSTSLKKAYSVDNGLSENISFSLSDDTGRLLENCVFHELKRKEFEIYYHKAKFECDFLIKKKNQIIKCIQVCAELSDSNKKREFGGIKEAMKRFHLNEGLIITLEQKFEENDIEVIPITEWLLS
ncbi:MAG: ATP-binding protein [Melioribacteraceae bacterium]|nr:ATP-binding protein [Melioribacteraceae bacterium]